jgi:protein TonB
MKNIILLSISIFFFFQYSTAQVSLLRPAAPIIDSSDRDNQIFTKVEQEATFPGGLLGWKTYIQNNLNGSVPVNNKAPVGKYMVIIRFVVSKSGAITNVEAETNYGYGMEQEVIRIIKNGPKWIPGIQGGREVNSYRRQPVTFLVEQQ